MKKIVALAWTLSTLLVAASTSAGSPRPDIIVKLDQKSMVDVEFETLGSVALQLQSGLVVLGTEDARCTKEGCKASLNALAATLGDFDITVEVSSGPSTVGKADVAVVRPSINIYGPVEIVNGGSGFVVPEGTPIQFTAIVKAVVDLGYGKMDYPATTLYKTSTLTSPLFINYQVDREQVFTLNGEFEFELSGSQMVSERLINFEVAGKGAILGSGLTPFVTAPGG